MTLLSGCVDNNLAPGLRAALVARFLLGIRCASRCVLGGAPDKTPCTSVLRGKVKGTELSLQWTQALTALFELSFAILRK